MLKYTTLQFARQVECAKQAGIYDAMFLAFGSLLGHVRDGGFIEGDDDMDVGIYRERITAEQEAEYVRLLGSPTDIFPDKGLFEYRRRETRRESDGRLFWLSIRGRPDAECYKCCHWFFWNDKGYTWHSKGPGSLVKGAPAQYVEGLGPEVEFLGTTIRAPRMTGAILDYWYTDWGTKRLGGCSAKKTLLKVSDWSTVSGTVAHESV